MQMTMEQKQYHQRCRYSFQLKLSLFGCCALLLIGCLHYVDMNISNGSSSSSSSNALQTSRRLTSYPSNSDYLMAYEQSDGFFTDIPRAHWELVRDRVRHRINHGCLSMSKDICDRYYGYSKPRHWFQDNYEPYFTCWHEERIGMGVGGKWVCDPYRISAKGEKCLIYSVGPSPDYIFEKNFVTNVNRNCEIHVFDDVPSETTNLPPRVSFHNWKIGSAPVSQKTLEKTVKELGHVGRTIDIFTIDCNGCEWNDYESWLIPSAPIQQILLRIHGIHSNADKFFEKLEDSGYLTFHKEANTKGITSMGAPFTIEYAFIKLGSSFFEGLDLQVETPYLKST